LKVRILPFLTTFAQLTELSARLKNFLGGWLLVLGIKEGLVECATVCVKSVVILKNRLVDMFVPFFKTSCGHSVDITTEGLWISKSARICRISNPSVIVHNVLK
jgi:hypothetical protein